MSVAVLQHESRLFKATLLQDDEIVRTDVGSSSPPEEVPFAVDRPLGIGDLDGLAHRVVAADHLRQLERRW